MEALLFIIILILFLIAIILTRILFLVSATYKRVARITEKPDKAREAYEKYLSEKT
ncbi:hypothetical protein LCM10_02185 [Rossellomorea aquimaris]|uniref:hypothetical protein n=1 Tax=Rossellomorea aquimaris TaxID=189382 RepID=UPI001CD36EB0|nr:hypothetical protein [Rossellomorea aquimaris]MCA1053780.1 hypothetical protein [Rossellomorea aquimaris]